MTDGTGETLEWSTSRIARRSIIFRTMVLNKSKASVTMSGIPDIYDEYETNVVSDDIFKIKLDSTDPQFGGNKHL
ncbi:hypothetical protein RF031_00370, partial [Acinetobacter baumannii]|nr:hypothetical protein [Acinetobacter baumannii]